MSDSKGKQLNQVILDSLKESEIKEIRKNYTIIDIPIFAPIMISNKISTNTYFLKNPDKKKIIEQMIHFYLSDNNKYIYKKTDYLCSEKEKICFCNLHANQLRTIYDKHIFSDEKDVKYVHWYEKRPNDSLSFVREKYLFEQL